MIRKNRKKMGARGRRTQPANDSKYQEPELIASISDVRRVIREKQLYDTNGNPELEQVAAFYKIAIRRELLPSLQSGYLRHTKEGWVIGVNVKHPIARQRFTIAHELGHYVMHRNDNGSTDFEDEIFFRATDVSPMEYAANTFAADLLMPDDKVRGEISGGIRDLSVLANKFEVSLEAMRYKVESLGYIIR